MSPRRLQQITKVFSGALSDWLGQRKLLLVIGYGLAAVTKPIFPLAPSVEWLVAARFVDRVGKGIRGAPRDALVADIAPAHLRGASFGLRQSLDTLGALIGPLLAITLMGLTSDSFATVFWVAVIPAFLSVGLVVAAVREPARPRRQHAVGAFPRGIKLRRFGTNYWWVVGVATAFTLARFSEAFLVLRAQSIGLPIMLTPAVLVAMTAAYAVSAYPVGALSDRVGRTTVLMIGFVLLIAADVMLATATGIGGLIAGSLLWGLHMGFTQGLFAALIADAAPADLRGTAFGTFNLITGTALLLASLGAGALWDRGGTSGNVSRRRYLHLDRARGALGRPRSAGGATPCVIFALASRPNRRGAWPVSRGA